MKPGQTLRDIYDERKALYEKFADRIIDVDAPSPCSLLQQPVNDVHDTNTLVIRLRIAGAGYQHLRVGVLHFR